MILLFSSHVRELADMALTPAPLIASRFHMWSVVLMRLGEIASDARLTRDP